MIDHRVFIFPTFTTPYLPSWWPKEDFERDILIHEIGHALRMADWGIPITVARATADGPSHSTDDETVMSKTFIDISPHALREGRLVTVCKFDDADLADLRNFRAIETASTA